MQYNNGSGWHPCAPPKLDLNKCGLRRPKTERVERHGLGKHDPLAGYIKQYSISPRFKRESNERVA